MWGGVRLTVGKGGDISDCTVMAFVVWMIPPEQCRNFKDLRLV